MSAPAAGSSHMQRASLPVYDYHWHEIPRPGGHKHISIEEYAAYIWALEERIHRPKDFGTRNVCLGDNTTQVGAHAKGRSSSLIINHYCRKDCAVQCAGNLLSLEIWVPSKDMPADRASSVFGLMESQQCC